MSFIRTSFSREYFVGTDEEDIAGVRNSYTTISGAISAINALPSSEGPAEDRTFIINVLPGTYQEAGLWIPDWVWLKGAGRDNTKIIENNIDTSVMVSIGVGGISDIAVAAVECTLGAVLDIRDSDSVYSLTEEPFSISGGETLDLDWGSTATVTFQAGDTTASGVAARINAADPFLYATDVGGRVRISKQTTVKSTGTANSIFGWSTTIDTTPIDISQVELRTVDGVFLVVSNMSPSWITDYMVSVRDTSSNSTFLSHISMMNISQNVKGLYFEGGSLVLDNCNIQGGSEAVSIDMYFNSQTSSFSNIFFESGQISTIADDPGGTHIKFNNDSCIINIGSVTYNPNKIDFGTTAGSFIKPRVQADAIILADQYGFFGSTWAQAASIEDAVTLLADETRQVFFPSYLSTDTGVNPTGERANLGELTGLGSDPFVVRVFPSNQNRKTVLQGKVPDIPNVGIVDKKIVLHIVTSETTGFNYEAKWFVTVSSIGANQSFTGSTYKVVLDKQHIVSSSQWQRGDLTILIDESLAVPAPNADIIQSGRILRIEIERENSFTPTGGYTNYPDDLLFLGATIKFGTSS